MFVTLADENRRVRVWPDGRALLDQPVKLTQAFGVLSAEIGHWADNAARRG